MNLEDRLRQSLSMNAAAAKPRNSWPWLESRLRERSTHNRRVGLGAGLVALLLFATAFALFVFTFRGAVARRSPATSLANGGAHVAATIAVGETGSLSSGALAAANGSTWISAQDASPQVVRIDQETDRVVASIPVDAPLPYLLFAEGSVWGAGHVGPTLFVVRIDQHRDIVSGTIRDVGGPIGSGAGAIWATLPPDKHSSSSIARIDPATEEITDVIPLGGSAAQIAVAGGSVWVLLDASDNEIVRIDATRQAIVDAIDVPGDAAALVAGGNGLWVSTWNGADSAMFRIDALSGTIVEGPIRYRGNAVFSAGLGGVWSLGERGAVYRLNASSLETDIELFYGQPPAKASTQPTAALDAQTQTIWVGNYDGSVTRIDVS